MIQVLQANLVIPQGSVFEQPIAVKESGETVDLTGYSARMQVRQFKDSDNPLLDLTSANGGMVITPSLGLVTIRIDATVTTALPIVDGWYDVEIVDSGGEPTRIMAGRASVSAEITR